MEQLQIEVPPFILRRRVCAEVDGMIIVVEYFLLFISFFLEYYFCIFHFLFFISFLVLFFKLIILDSCNLKYSVVDYFYSCFWEWKYFFVYFISFLIKLIILDSCNLKISAVDFDGTPSSIFAGVIVNKKKLENEPFIIVWTFFLCLFLSF